MFPTRAVLSKASRLPLISKHANKDFYKGNRTAYLPGGHRTGAPGVHVVRGKGKYRIIDEKVRVFIAPPLDELNSTPLRPYVATKVRMSSEEKLELYGELPKGGFDARHYLKMMKEREGGSQSSAGSLFEKEAS